MKPLILATGTNGSRAATFYDVDHYNNVTYFDMLVTKGELNEGTCLFRPRRTLPFKVATNINRIPNVEFYQLAFPQVVVPEVMKDNMPSWTKAVENCHKAKGFIQSVFGALFNGDSDVYEYMNLENVFGGHRPTSVMIWLPENGTKRNVDQFAKVLQPIIPQWDVIPLHGDYTTNREAEDLIKKRYAAAKKDGKLGVVVCAMKMGARSFGVPQIDTVLLAYDNGSAAQTAQKMSRCLTPYSDGTEKIGRVVSLSLDPTREDRIDAPLLETAQKVAEKENIDIQEALKKVFRTLNIFTMDNHGDRVCIDIDQYAEKVMNVSTLSRVIAKTADLNEILNDKDMIENILKITVVASSIGTPDHVVEKGKKFVDGRGKVKKNAKADNDEEKEVLSLLKRIQAAIEALSDNMPFVAYLAPKETSVKNILKSISNDKDSSKVFIDEFGVESIFVLGLLEKQIFNVHLTNLLLLEQRKYDLLATTADF